MKMYIKMHAGKDGETTEVGDLKKTGTTDKGGVTFEVENWKPDSKIWPHEKMYGIYQLYYGEQKLFTFLELAIADKPITDLYSGLHGLYFVGWNCIDKGVGQRTCDFSSASPVPPSFFTPKEKNFFIQ